MIPPTMTEFRRRYLTALGQIVHSFGLVEYQLHSLLAMMLNDFRLADNLTFGYQLDRVIEALRAVFYSKDRDSDAKIIFEYLMEQLGVLAQQRNTNFHCQWHFDEKHERGHRIKFLKHKHGIVRIRAGETFVPVSDLEQLHSEILRHMKDLAIFELWYFDHPDMADHPPGAGLGSKDSRAKLLAIAQQFAKSRRP